MFYSELENNFMLEKQFHVSQVVGVLALKMALWHGNS